MSKIHAKNNELIKGTSIYFIGNALTQLIAFFLLKLVTENISAEEYGYFNLIITIDNVITPIVTLQISDAVFKFLITSDSFLKKTRIFSSAFAVFFVGTLLLCFLIFIIRSILDIKYSLWVLLYILSTNYFYLLQKIVRGLGYNILFVKANLLKALIYFVLIYLFVKIYQFEIQGLFAAYCISSYFCLAYMWYGAKIYTYFSFKEINFDTFKTLLNFSLPLIPNTAVWWLISSINAILITKELGLHSNGVYSVALKFAAIINLVITVFDLSWQESSIKEFSSNLYRDFASTVFYRYIVFLLSCISILILIVRLVVDFMIDREYYDAILYIPFLYISCFFAASSGFFAQILVAGNSTRSLLYTNALGALFNIIFVYFFIKYLGLWTVVVSSIISYCIVSVSRFFFVKRYLNLSDIKFNLLFFQFILIVFCMCSYYFNNIFLTISLLLLSLFVFMHANKELIIGIYNKIKILL